MATVLPAPASAAPSMPAPHSGARNSGQIPAASVREGQAPHDRLEADLPPLAAELPGPAPTECGPRRTYGREMDAVPPAKDLIAPPSKPTQVEDLELFDPEGELAEESAEAETPVASKPPRTVRFTPQPMEAVKVSAAPATPPAVTEDRPAFMFPEALELQDTTAPSLASSSSSSSSPSSGATHGFDPRPGIVAFAGYGLPPEKLSETPSYALHVLARRRVLREGLEMARRRRPRDIELYEAALQVADQAAVRKGLALLAALVLVALGVLGALVGVLR